MKVNNLTKEMTIHAWRKLYPEEVGHLNWFKAIIRYLTLHDSSLQCSNQPCFFEV